MTKAKRTATPEDAPGILNMQSTGVKRKIKKKSIKDYSKAMKQRSLALKEVSTTSKQMQRLKKNASIGNAAFVRITPSIASLLLFNRASNRLFDADIIVCKAFEILSGYRELPVRMIAVNFHTGKLLSGAYELMGFLYSGKAEIKLLMVFTNDDNTANYSPFCD